MSSSNGGKSCQVLSSTLSADYHTPSTNKCTQNCTQQCKQDPSSCVNIVQHVSTNLTTNAAKNPVICDKKCAKESEENEVYSGHDDVIIKCDGSAEGFSEKLRNTCAVAGEISYDDDHENVDNQVINKSLIDGTTSSVDESYIVNGGPPVSSTLISQSSDIKFDGLNDISTGEASIEDDTLFLLRDTPPHLAENTPIQDNDEDTLYLLKDTPPFLKNDLTIENLDDFDGVALSSSFSVAKKKTTDDKSLSQSYHFQSRNVILSLILISLESIFRALS